MISRAVIAALIRLLRLTALVLTTMIGAWLLIAYLHAPGWSLIPLVVVVCSVGSFLEWLERRRDNG
jgi:hypothetical protein